MYIILNITCYVSFIQNQFARVKLPCHAKADVKVHKMDES